MWNKMRKCAFEEKIRKFVREHQLLSGEGKYLIGLSGGADSMALLRVMLRLGFHVEAVHCNFHLRGDEADRDEVFCKNACEQLGVELHLLHFDTKLYALSHKISIEMAARDMRYGFFEQMRKDIGADGILVAHHKDDSVETVLMNLIRGTGIHGLTGIAPRNGHILRPLLCVDRQEIELYLREIHQDFVTDSTNLVDDVVRNKIRLRVLPLLREINPSVSDSVLATAARLSQVAELLDDTIRKMADDAIVSDENNQKIFAIDKISNEYTLFHLLRPFSFSPALIVDIDKLMRENGVSGKTFLSATHELLIDRGHIIVQPLEKPVKPMKIPETGTYVLPNGEKLRIKEMAVDDDFVISKTPEKVCLDASKVRFPLMLRQTSAGDRFRPLGMKGSRLVSDFMTDRKMSLFEKRRQLLLEDADGKIIWLIGLRPDNQCRITPQTTTALVLDYCSVKTN